MVRHEVLSYGHREGRVRGRQSVCTVIFCISTSGQRSMIVIWKENSQVNEDEKSMASTETNDLEAVSSGWPPELWQNSVAREIPAPMRNVVHNTSAQVFEVLIDVSTRKIPPNEEF